MGAEPRFQAERQRAAGPDARGTGTSKFANAAAPPAAPAGADPRVTPPYDKLRVRDRYDCSDMEQLALASKTFEAHLAALRKHGGSIDYEVIPLPPQAGGGRTWPSPTHDYLVQLDPKTVKAGFHVFDVFLHEHGHVAEYLRVAFEGAREGKYYLLFMNRVQAELGLRVSPDSHETPKAGRAP